MQSRKLQRREEQVFLLQVQECGAQRQESPQLARYARRVPILQRF